MSDLATINYQPLSPDDKAMGLVVRRQWPLYIFGAVVAVWACTFMFFLGLLVIFILFGYATVQAAKLKNNAWQQFAVANGWQLDPMPSVTSLVPYSVQFDGPTSLSPVIMAQLGNVTAKLFVYSVTTGSGKSRQVYTYTVAQVRLPKSLPHIFLKAKKDNRELPIQTMQRQPSFMKHETLQLEGDFNDYFTLQIEKGQEIDALTVITPDVMQTLITYSQAENIEIVTDGLYFILPGDDRGPKAVEQLVRSVVELSGQIVEQVHLTSGPDSAVTPANAPN